MKKMPLASNFKTVLYLQCLHAVTTQTYSAAHGTFQQRCGHSCSVTVKTTLTCSCFVAGGNTTCETVVVKTNHIFKDIIYLTTLLFRTHPHALAGYCSLLVIVLM